MKFSGTTQIKRCFLVLLLVACAPANNNQVNTDLFDPIYFFQYHFLPTRVQEDAACRLAYSQGASSPRGTSPQFRSWEISNEVRIYTSLNTLYDFCWISGNGGFKLELPIYPTSISIDIPKELIVVDSTVFIEFNDQNLKILSRVYSLEFKLSDRPVLSNDSVKTLYFKIPRSFFNQNHFQNLVKTRSITVVIRINGKEERLLVKQI